MIKLNILVLACLFLLPACASMRAKNKPSPQINDVWVLTYLEGVKIKESEFRNRPTLEINLSNQRFIGNDGCNAINGQITTNGKQRIQFIDMAATEMYCEDSPESLHFQQLLLAVTQYEYIKMSLTLKDKNNITILQFQKKD